MAVAITRPIAGTSDTSNTTSYSYNAFTYSANALLLFFVFASGTTSQGLITGGGLVWVLGGRTTANGDTLYFFWAKTPATGASITPIFTCVDDAATGTIMCALECTGVDQTTRNPIKQVATNGATSTNANVTFTSALGTNNGYAIMWAGGLTANVSTAPAGWTEDADGAFANPSRNASLAHRATGETGTTYTFTNASTPWIALGCEVYASGAGPVLLSQLAMTGVG